MKKKFSEGIKVSFISISINIFLFIFKLFGGLIGKSNAMISDSIHSLTDVLASIVVFIGLKLSNKKSDKEHPYGHERIESIAAFLLSIILFITGFYIGLTGIKTIFSSNYSTIETPTFIALIVSIIVIIIKEGMYRYTKKIAKKINSNALMADAWHHRIDALASIGGFIGIIGSMLGFKLLDVIASIAISLCIVKAALEIFIDSINKIIDKSCNDEYVSNVKSIILETNGVKSIDSIKTRLFGSKVYIDIEIGVDEDLLLKDAHQISHNVHDKIEDTFKDVKHCMIHVNPNNN